LIHEDTFLIFSTGIIQIIAAGPIPNSPGHLALRRWVLDFAGVHVTTFSHQAESVEDGAQKEQDCQVVGEDEDGYDKERDAAGDEEDHGEYQDAHWSEEDFQ